MSSLIDKASDLIWGKTGEKPNFEEELKRIKSYAPRINPRINEEQTTEPQPKENRNEAEKAALLGKKYVKFSRDIASDQEKNLYVAHNLNERKLRHIFDLRGLAAPSLAVARADMSPYQSFGDITLLAESSILESSKTKVFDADVYSPRYPSPVNVVDDKAYGEFVKWLKDERHKLRPVDSSDIEGARDFTVLVYNDSVRYAWLRDKGIVPKATKANEFNLYKSINSKFRTKKIEKEFEDFARQKFDELVAEKKIFKGYL